MKRKFYIASLNCDGTSSRRCCHDNSSPDKLRPTSETVVLDEYQMVLLAKKITAILTTLPLSQKILAKNTLGRRTRSAGFRQRSTGAAVAGSKAVGPRHYPLRPRPGVQTGQVVGACGFANALLLPQSHLMLR
eukprot:1192616-Prorocentrum_minimum.AAC.1